MIRLEHVYALAGLMFAAISILNLRDRSNPKRFKTALFWALVAASFLFGARLGDFANGLVALTLAALAGFGGLGRGRIATTSPEERREGARRHGDRLFIPAVIIPVVALLGSLFLKQVQWGGTPLLEPKQATLISLALGVLLALAVALPMLKAPPAAPVREAARLMDAVGWAAMLPQMLAALGAVFAMAGVGRIVGDLTVQWLPLDTRLAAVCAYAVGMALFTVIMGNGFAAFPVMTAAIGLPLIVGKFGGDPAVMGAIGMLSGFCGTLMTPMAANFNIVPAALLELKDRNAVIRVQTPTALLLLLVNIGLMYVLAFH
ncbi:MAG: DUF979 domain-containing protein [Caulobacteraceae bacterium]|nr:DUF979 domain-containing protein [Caulobacteraceae bacterium]